MGITRRLAHPNPIPDVVVSRRLFQIHVSARTRRSRQTKPNATRMLIRTRKRWSLIYLLIEEYSSSSLISLSLVNQTKRVRISRLLVYLSSSNSFARWSRCHYPRDSVQCDTYHFLPYVCPNISFCIHDNRRHCHCRHRRRRCRYPQPIRAVV
jgi:hypothetical protein